MRLNMYLILYLLNLSFMKKKNGRDHQDYSYFSDTLHSIYMYGFSVVACRL